MAHLRRLLCLLGLVFGLGAAPVAAGLPLEYAVKASYLYKFAPFVQWPTSAFSGAAGPLTICIAGQDPFGSALDDAVRGQRANGHPILIRRLESTQPDISCHILFLGGEGTEDMLRSVAHEPVLTVTDRNHGGSGGMIQFVMTGGRVRFAIDQNAAQESGIVISSKLLDLAVSVNR